MDISNRRSIGEQKKITKADLSRVHRIADGSRAAKAGVQVGDRLIAINGEPIRDMIDYQFQAADEKAVLTVERDQPEGTRRIQIKLKNAVGEPLGLEFAEPTFDGIKVCNNDCPFCFVYRTPKGFRPTLYVKDDDYRYSFMYGGFVTLTNLKEADWQRIIEQRLTPLYVSVHSTDLGMRRRLLGNANAPDIIEQLKRLIANGIEIHTQIVLVPTINDGVYLERTVNELAALYPGVQTVAVVPVGLAGGAGYEGDRRKSQRAHGRGFESEDPMPMRPFTAEEAAQVIAQAHTKQKQFKQVLKTAFVYLSDEFYLLSGQDVPGRAHYLDFDQIENGVGLVRHFLDDWKKTEKRLPLVLPHPLRATIVTATLITPIFHPIIARLNQVEGLQLELLTVSNAALGATVTVAGLLTGRDVIDALLKHQAAGHELGEVVFLPQVMLDKKGYGGRFLDNLTPADVAHVVGRKVVMAGLISEVWNELRKVSTEPRGAEWHPPIEDRE